MDVKRDIVCFGLAEWDSPLPTNQHHLARRLACSGRVLFLDTVGIRRPRFEPADLFRAVRRVLRARRGPREAEPSIWRLSALGPVPGMRGFQRRWLGRSFARAVAGAIRELDLTCPVAWFFNPRAAMVLGAEFDGVFGRNRPGEGFGAIVYHAVDDLRVVPGADVEDIEYWESFLAERADLVLASAPALFERLSTMAPGRAQYAPNVVDFDHFHRAAEAGALTSDAMGSVARPRIVFAGNLTPSKIDFALLEKAIRERPDWQWVMIGPVWEGDSGRSADTLRRLPNAHLLGPAPYEDLPEMLAGADVFIIPYRTDGVNDSVFPLKFFEYLATGKPVVSTRLPSLESHGDAVCLAEGVEGFLSALEGALADDGGESGRGRRIALARAHSWDSRMKEIDGWLASAEERKASV